MNTRMERWAWVLVIAVTLGSGWIIVSSIKGEEEKREWNAVKSLAISTCQERTRLTLDECETRGAKEVYDRKRIGHPITLGERIRYNRIYVEEWNTIYVPKMCKEEMVDSDRWKTRFESVSECIEYNQSIPLPLN